MKPLLISTILLVLLPSFADDISHNAVLNSDDKQVAKTIDRSKLQKALYKRNGGMIKFPGSQQGTIYYINAQKRVPLEWIEQNARVFAELLKIAIEVKDGTFSFPNPNIIGNASLFVVDDDNLPSILHAPESRWCMVNVASLAHGVGQKQQFFSARVQKELTRGFSLLAGTQSSNYPKSILSCITKPEDLDVFEDCRLPVDILSRFTPYLAGYGVKPYTLFSYRKACEEGWAPAPTNDVQKAIWDKVHAMPTEPIKIKPEEKKTEK